MILFKNIAFVVLIIAECLSREVPSVSIRSSKIIGHYKISAKGNRYEAYEGIPYALPPIGERRFEPPEPILSWPSKIIADKQGSICLQFNRELASHNVYGTEDCLYLDIYVPVRRDNASLPVIFYIHGGGFQYGGDTEQVAPYLIDHNVITVQIHYRLGTLGFLSTEDEVISGNMGLKDQALALKWVHENIRYFDGDSKRIILTGLSAGGASVHYHYLSPMSRGLFHSGISFSGTALNCWSQSQDSRRKTFELAEIAGCSTNDVLAMVKCLKKRPARSLMEAIVHFMPWGRLPPVPFGPVVEKSSEQTFIDRSPIEIIASGDAYDVPWITGVVSEEGLYPVDEFIRDDALEEINNKWNLLAPYLLNYDLTVPKEQYVEVAKKVRDHYFEDKPINRENLEKLIDVISDRWFKVDAEKAAVVQARFNKSPVRFYHYSHRAENSLSEELTNSTENFGVCHGDDVFLVLENPTIIPTKNPVDLAMHNDLVKIWVTVAQKSVPEIGYEWSKVETGKSSLNYLHIAGPGNLNMKQSDNFSKKKFWDSIGFKENEIN